MRIVIVTGMSGAGKRSALKVFEDLGYYCVDNLPVELVLDFVELAVSSNNEINNVAICVDVRVGESFSKLEEILEIMSDRKYEHEVLFLEAENEVLIKRYKETRRNHPLAGYHRIMDGIEKEREEIAFIRKKADYIIDTSALLARELRAEIKNIFQDNYNFQNLMVTILSFGFKYGIPEDADLVFDVRFLPNPYYIEELKPLTGNDEAVQNYVLSFDIAHEFLDKLSEMIKFLIPNYIIEGKNRLVIAVGCTGGRHRSVTLANELFNRLKCSEYGVNVEHRDIDMDSKRKK